MPVLADQQHHCSRHSGDHPLVHLTPSVFGLAPHRVSPSGQLGTADNVLPIAVIILDQSEVRSNLVSRTWWT